MQGEDVSACDTSFIILNKGFLINILMQHSKKLILNTLALYIKIGIKAIVMLIVTRISLLCLGQEDFGLYNLIAGIIVLLSFLNGSLIISTQRFLSIAIGEGNYEKLSSIFNVSLEIHVVLAVLVGAVFFFVQPLLFNGFLQISESSRDVAIIIYDIMILTSLITIATIPYSAVMNAHEDMVAFAFSEIAIVVVQLLAAIVLLFLNENKLYIYTCIMAASVFIGFITKYVWCIYKYEESRIVLSKMKNKELVKEMLGFVGWNTLGSLAVVVRNQGVAVVLNLFFGTVANAAYGIANQINSLVLTFATTLTTVFTPSIVQNKGAGNEKQMVFIATLSSKMSYLLSGIMALPIILNMNYILHLWLKEIPENTEIFSICIIIAFLFTQMCPGINRAIYATGKIKGYQIGITMLLTATIPLGIICFELGLFASSILWILISTQFAVFIITVYIGHKLFPLNAKSFLSDILKGTLSLGSMVGCGMLLYMNIEDISLLVRIVTSILLIACFTILFYKYTFHDEEHIMINKLLSIVYKRIHK